MSDEKSEHALSNIIENIAKGKIELLLYFHQILLVESRRIFTWALTGASIGLVLLIMAAVYTIITAAVYTIWTGKAAAIILLISGTVVEVIAGILFYLYGKTTSKMADLHSRFERLQRYLLANSICESVQGEERDKTRSDLIREIAAGTLRTTGAK